MYNFVIMAIIGTEVLTFNIIKNRGIHIYLVGGLVAIFYFPINIGNLIIPNDVHIFQRGGPTTNQLCTNPQ